MVDLERTYSNYDPFKELKQNERLNDEHDLEEDIELQAEDDILTKIIDLEGKKNELQKKEGDVRDT